MRTGRPLTGYARFISVTLGLDDPATLELVERLMRQETGGVLDHLGADVFARLARQAYEDARTWNEIGAVAGVTLAGFCRAEQIDVPGWVAAEGSAS